MEWSEEELRGLMVDRADFGCGDEVVRLDDVKR